MTDPIHEYPSSYDPDLLTEQSRQWRNHDHQHTLKDTSGGANAHVLQCECGAWRTVLDNTEHPWQPGWEPTCIITQEEAAIAVAPLPATREGYAVAVALAIHHSGVTAKNEQSPLDFGNTLLPSMDEAQFTDDHVNHDAMTRVYYAIRLVGLGLPGFTLAHPGL